MSRHAIGGSLISLAVAATVLLSLPSSAGAESYFCTLGPMKIGSYSPDDSPSELDISVKHPGFWFDAQSGDFVSYQKGVAGQLQPGKVHLPLLDRTYLDYPTALVTLAYTSHQCTPAPMGVLPSEPRASP